jgi:hypothetical protein
LPSKEIFFFFYISFDRGGTCQLNKLLGKEGFFVACFFFCLCWGYCCSLAFNKYARIKIKKKGEQKALEGIFIFFFFAVVVFKIWLVYKQEEMSLLVGFHINLFKFVIVIVWLGIN